MNERRADVGTRVDASALDALAWGLLDGGVGVVTGYPGFHAHELVERCGGSFSVNERTAYAVAWGGAVAGVRSAVAFKNVGLNDAADPFLNSLRLRTNAGLVVVVFDDVEVAGSQCRQDSRPYFNLCPGLWLEPVSATHAYWCAREAPVLSERFGTPVVLRVTNPLLRSRGAVVRKATPVPARPFCRDPAGFVAHPVNAHRQAEAADQRQQRIAAYVESHHRRSPPCSPPSVEVRVGAAAWDGAVAPGAGRCTVWTYPLPEKSLRRRLRRAGAVTVSELGSPFVCEKVQALTSRVETRFHDASAGVDHSCQYRVCRDFDSLFQALRSFPDRIVCGDLGSFTMDPDRTVDACLCYGAGVAVAVGCGLVGHGRPVFCVTGDAAFLHSGQAALEEGRTRGARAVVIVLDNGGARSTGGQAIPGTIRIPPTVPILAADHATADAATYRSALTQLSCFPGLSALLVRC